MYKALYFKPKYRLGAYDKFINRFISNFHLKTIKQSYKEYILQNETMLVKVEPKLAEVFIYDDNNKDDIRKVKDYFYTY